MTSQPLFINLFLNSPFKFLFRAGPDLLSVIVLRSTYGFFQPSLLPPIHDADVSLPILTGDSQSRLILYPRGY